MTVRLIRDALGLAAVLALVVAIWWGLAAVVMP